MPSPAPAVQALGGIATFAELRSTVSRREIERALARDEISKDRRGRYVLASTPQHLRVAHELSAVLSHESAALHYGWKVKSAPELPVVTVRHSRRLSAQDRTRCSAHYSNLPASYVHQGVTTPTRTVLDCARLLPFDRALVVADSALRAGDVARDRLRTDAAQLRGRGAARARAVAHEASYVSANPLESVLRAIALGVSGYSFVPQLRIWDHGLYATVDLGDRGLKVALEAEGFAFHGGRKEFRRDCRRYDELMAWGWTVFRFAWEHVMLDPDFVVWTLDSWLRTRRGHAVVPPPAPTRRLA
ncbi:MAG: DUF559 domain-containing protein [Ornithinimicrobium sp.]